MTRILIVDDEILVRLSLKTLIPWSEHGFEIVGEARNGKEALELLEKDPCHIVLTDIRMPDMDGLELISRIREKWPYTRCLILSNHNDFEYVRKALRLGAVDYLLKLAWVPEELLEKCKRLQSEFRQEEEDLEEKHRAAFQLERLSREAREKLLRDLLTKHTSKLEIANSLAGLEFDFETSRFRVAAVAIDSYERVLEEDRYQSEQLLNYTVANILNEMVRKNGGGELVEVGNGRFALLSSAITEELLKQLQQVAETYAKVTLSFGVSREHREMFGLHHAFAEAEETLQKRFFRGGGTLLFADAPPRRAAGEPVRLVAANAAGWLRLFESRQTEAILPELAAWHSQWAQAEELPPAEVRDEWLHLLVLLNKSLESDRKDIYSVPAYLDQYPFEVVRNSETLSEIHEWFSGWLTQTMTYVKETAGARLRPEIQAVLDIIQQEYHTQLKVSDIARRVGFAENYLSVLFRKETGEKIVDTLTAVRMKKARELLLDPGLKIYEISEMVGYTDSNHFSKYFKKIEGVFPLEFRKMALGK
ncbi:MAG: two-component system response regulator [Paenibacillaceae bacterium]|jgi:YesN/AraC family two-component response regulator|nr:two-component system response regulator [Paenibacillaceae bacterium]